MIRHALFAAAILCLSTAWCPEAIGQATNHPDPTLVVNANADGAFPLYALLGQTDPGLIDIQSKPGAGFFLLFGPHDDGTFFPGLGTLHVKLDGPFGMLAGTLDANGQAQIVMAPGALAQIPAGTKAAVQALVQDRTVPAGYRPSGATDIEVVPTLSAPIAVNPGTGSQVQARALLTDVTPNSVSIGNLPFVLSAATQFSNFQQLSDLKLGDFLVVEGFYNAQGVLEAEQVSLEDWEQNARLRGMVQAKGPSAVVLLGVTVYVSSSTIFDDAGQPASFAQVNPATIMEVVVPLEVPFPAATTATINIPAENEPEPEDVPEDEQENESPPPSFCS